MKLLHCLICGDVIALHMERRICRCGESSGRYLPDAVGTALYSGRSRVLGINNEEMRRSEEVVTVLDQDGMSTPRFEWFVILEGQHISHVNKIGEGDPP